MMKISDTESVVVMSVADWIAVRDNPRQRDTERHAKKASKAHLKVLADEHKTVYAAILPTGEMVKLDGHTRAYLWQTGKLDSPPFVVVHAYKVRDLQEAATRYLRYDSSEAVEGNMDRIAGAMNQHELVFQTNFLRGGKYLTALCLAKHGSIDSRHLAGEGLYSLMEHFRSRLLMLDDLNPNKDRFVAGVMAAYLLTVGKHGASAMPFWDAYNRGMGEKSGRERDAVQALEEMVQLRRVQKTLAARQHVVDVCGKAISACERWLRGESYTTGLKATDVQAYLRSATVSRIKRAA